MNTKQITRIGVYAALIVTSIVVFRIPTSATQFIHFGNAFVAVGVLLLGSKEGALAAAIGLTAYDLMAGYGLSFWVTVLESLIVCGALHLVYERLWQRATKPAYVIGAAVLAAATKIVLNFIKYTFFYGMIGKQLPFLVAAAEAVTKITGTFGSAALTVVSVPILFAALRQVLQRTNFLPETETNQGAG